MWPKTFRWKQLNQKHRQRGGSCWLLWRYWYNCMKLPFHSVLTEFSLFYHSHRDNQAWVTVLSLDTLHCLNEYSHTYLSEVCVFLHPVIYSWCKLITTFSMFIFPLNKWCTNVILSTPLLSHILSMTIYNQSNIWVTFNPFWHLKAIKNHINYIL